MGGVFTSEQAAQVLLDGPHHLVDDDLAAAVFLAEFVDDADGGRNAHVGFHQAGFDLFEAVFIEHLARFEQIANVGFEKLARLDDRALEFGKQSHDRVR